MNYKLVKIQETDNFEICELYEKTFGKPMCNIDSSKIFSWFYINNIYNNASWENKRIITNHLKNPNKNFIWNIQILTLLKALYLCCFESNRKYFHMINQACPQLIKN